MENTDFKVGQKIKYKGKESHIEVIHNDGTCNIANPEWDWDMEAECVNLGIDYNVPYWINVKLNGVNRI